jgi:hypothetical protein
LPEHHSIFQGDDLLPAAACLSSDRLRPPAGVTRYARWSIAASTVFAAASPRSHGCNNPLDVAIGAPHIDTTARSTHRKTISIAWDATPLDFDALPAARMTDFYALRHEQFKLPSPHQCRVT